RVHPTRHPHVPSQATRWAKSTGGYSRSRGIDEPQIVAAGHAMGTQISSWCRSDQGLRTPPGVLAGRVGCRIEAEIDVPFDRPEVRPIKQVLAGLDLSDGPDVLAWDPRAQRYQPTVESAAPPASPPPPSPVPPPVPSPPP